MIYESKLPRRVTHKGRGKIRIRARIGKGIFDENRLIDTLKDNFDAWHGEMFEDDGF